MTSLLPAAGCGDDDRRKEDHNGRGGQVAGRRRASPLSVPAMIPWTVAARKAANEVVDAPPDPLADAPTHVEAQDDTVRPMAMRPMPTQRPVWADEGDRHLEQVYGTLRSIVSTAPCTGPARVDKKIWCSVSGGTVGDGQVLGRYQEP
jgi:hypothetical protein